MRSIADMAKKEANFDLYIHDLLVEAGIQADTQGSNIVEINNALKTASKHQTAKSHYDEVVSGIAAKEAGSERLENYLDSLLNSKGDTP